MRASLLITKAESRRTVRTAVLLFVVLFAALLVLGAVLASPARAVYYTDTELAVVQLLNDYRVQNGLQPLLVSDKISEACDRHGSDMGKYKFFDHYTQGSDWYSVGASPWDRMAGTGYNYNTYKGENIAAGYATAQAVFDGWKSSSGHNANMLNGNFKVLGISLVVVVGSPYTAYWTTDFGGYVDPSAHSVNTPAPTTTTTQAPPTTAAPATTTSTTTSTTTTTLRPPATTTTSTTSTTEYSTTTTTEAPTTTSPPTTTKPAGSTGFADVNAGTLYAAAIEEVAQEGVVCGYQDGTFRPETPVTRQQFAKMIMVGLGRTVTQITVSPFRDVQPDPNSADPRYPVSYVAACAAAGITVGRTVDLFCPFESITRAQLITMVARAVQIPDPPDGLAALFEDFSPEHYPYALRAYAAGLLDGFVDMGRDFDFWAPATRAEVCLLLAQILD